MWEMQNFFSFYTDHCCEMGLIILHFNCTSCVIFDAAVKKMFAYPFCHMNVIVIQVVSEPIVSIGGIL